jgi:hypothetical protein
VVDSIAAMIFHRGQNPNCLQMVDSFVTLSITNPQKNSKFRLFVHFTFPSRDSQTLQVNRRADTSWFKISFDNVRPRTVDRVDRQTWQQILTDNLFNICLKEVYVQADKNHRTYFVKEINTWNFVGFNAQVQTLLDAPISRLTYRQCEQLLDDIGDAITPLSKIDPKSSCYRRYQTDIEQLNDKYEAVKSLCLNPEFVAKHYYPQAQREVETTLKRQRKTTGVQTSKRQRTKR